MLIKKLQLKAASRAMLMKAPVDVKEVLLSEHGAFKSRLVKEADFILAFVRSQEEAAEIIPKAIASIATGGRLWFAYPKKSGSIKSDMSRDVGWETIDEHGYIAIMSISLGDDWSALRFRPRSEVKKVTRKSSKEWAARRKDPSLREPVVVPDALTKKLNKGDRKFFDELSYSHRKEYVRWITEAKREETRERRVKKAVEAIKARKKSFYG
jgi:hypothetical protein